VGANKLDTNSDFEDERVRSAFAKATADRSPSPASIPRKIVAGRITSDFAFWICVSDLAE